MQDGSFEPSLGLGSFDDGLERPSYGNV
jgi:hypothetical protein